MITVNRENFYKLLPTIAKQIESCDLTAFDFEMTGLTSEDYRTSPFDTLEVRYSRYKQDVEFCFPIQFGLSLYTYNDFTRKYVLLPFVFAFTPFLLNGFAILLSLHLLVFNSEATRFKLHTYSFDIFPAAYRQFNKKWFGCEAASLRYLSDHHFDFNDWIYKGISFMDIQTEARIRKDFESALKEASKKPQKIAVGERDNKFVAETEALISEWLTTTEQRTFKLPATNAFRRKLIFQILHEKFKDEVFSYTPFSSFSNASVNLIRLAYPSERDECKSKLEEEERNNIEEAVGFRRIIDLLLQHKKPLVGHNCLLDLLHLYNRFLEPLPPTMKEFRSNLHQYFPTIIDTKHLCNHPLIQPSVGFHSSLENLGARIKDAPFQDIPIEPENETNGNSNSGTTSFHNAGFDALMTGKVFLAISEVLTRSLRTSKALEHPAMILHANKIRMYFAGKCHLDLDPNGNDSLPKNEHVFFVYRLKPSDKTQDLIDYYKERVGNNKITWLNDNAAFVEFSDFWDQPFPQEFIEKLEYPFQRFVALRFQAYAELRDNGLLNEDFSPKITKKRRFEETQNGDEEDGNNRKRTKYEVKEWPDFSCIIC